MGILPTSICQLHNDLFRRSSKYFKQEFGTAIELRGFPALSIGEIINCCHKIGIAGAFCDVWVFCRLEGVWSRGVGRAADDWQTPPNAHARAARSREKSLRGKLREFHIQILAFVYNTWAPL